MSRRQRSIAYRLTQRVVLQKPTTPTDGETTPTFSDVAPLRAEVVLTGGREYVRGRQVSAGTDAVVTIRHRAGVGTDWRFKWGTRFLNIVSAYDPDPDQSRNELVCECREEPS